MKLQLFSFKGTKKNSLRATNFQIRRIPFQLFQLQRKKKTRFTNYIWIYYIYYNYISLYKTETENKKEDRYLPLIIPAGIIGNRFCNFDKLFAGNRGMGKVRSISKFLCKERIVEHHGAHLPNYAIRASRRGREKRGEAKKKEARAAFELRSKTSPQPSPSSVFIQLLWAGRRRFVCARHTKFQPSKLTHKHFYPRFSELW